MANYDDAYKVTMGHEGGYSMDPRDKGGETYKGVSRRWFPDWKGWEIVEASRTTENFPKCLDEDQSLQTKVYKFYKNHFWNRFLGDSINNQEIAVELFDTAVNMSVRDSVKFLQRGLNVLNRNQALFPDMVEDGILGPSTLQNLNKYVRGSDVNILLKVMNVLQGNHYIAYMNKSPIQETYCRGWFNRVEIKKA